MLKKKEIQNLLKYYEDKQHDIRGHFRLSYLAHGGEHPTTKSLEEDIVIHEAYISTIEQILQIGGITDGN